MKLQPSPKAQLALTLVEVLVVVAALVLLVLVLLSALSKAHTCCKRVTCADNLNQVGLSFRIWAGDNGDRYPMQLSVTNGGTMEHLASGVAWPHFQVLSNELNTPKILVCPEDKPRMKVLEKLQAEPAESRSRAISFQNNCPLSYFVGVEAEESKPRMLLAGDDNLAIGGNPVRSGLLNLWTNSAVGWHKPRHPKGGNICFADGSVQQVNSAQLRETLVNTGVATNRLAMP